jgi:hypothetical protein
MTWRIELGSTEGLRHIGIQPPLSLHQIGLLNILGNQSGHPVSQFIDEVPPVGLPYSTAIMYIDAASSTENADKMVLDTAENIASRFNSAGYEIVIDETIHDLEVDTYLFNEQPLFVEQAEV